MSVNHYSAMMCLKELATGGVTANKLQDAFKKAHAAAHVKTVPSNEEIAAMVPKYLCVLPNGHAGKCTKSPHGLFVDKKIGSKIDTAVYSTPGSDGAVVFNRSTRVFPITVGSEDERKYRVAQAGKKAPFAIPSCEASTPYDCATMAFDIIMITLSIKGIETSGPYASMYGNSRKEHIDFLSNYFKTYGRTIVNADGYLLCPVTGHVFRSEDLKDVSRTVMKETDAQLGHCEPRCDGKITIRATNCIWMSRKGNRIVGDNHFLEDAWKTDLQNILDFQAK